MPVEMDTNVARAVGASRVPAAPQRHPFAGYSAGELLAYVAAWTAIGIIFGLQWWLAEPPLSRSDLTRTIASALVSWYTCAIVAIPIAILVRRRPIVGTRVAPQIAFYGAVIVIMAVARNVISAPIANAIFNTRIERLQTRP